MQLTGLPIETVTYLAALAAVVITALYLLKLRKRTVEIPFSPMWNRVLTDRRHSSDWWRRLKRLLSWLVHLLIAALLAFAMLGPHFDDEVIDERHVLILLDNSASMAATDVTGGHDRFDVGRRKAREMLETIGGDDRVMVALFNNRVQPLGPFVDDPTLLDASLRATEVTANPVDLSQALQFAADSLRDREPAELVVISDGAGFDPDQPLALDFGPATTVRHLQVGESSENLAVTAFNARRYPSNRLDHEIYVEVRSYFDRPVEAVLELRADGRLVETRPLELGSRDHHRAFYPGVASSGERLEARVRLTTADARDVFPLDDRAFAVIPPARRLQVLLVSPGNLFIEGPLILNSHVDFERVHPDDYSPDVDVDVVIFDRVAPEPPASGDLLYFAPPAEGSPFEINHYDDEPIITDVVTGHPLMRWITLGDLNIGEANTFAMTADDTAVASSFGRAIIAARETDDRRLVAVGFDLRNSDFPLRVSFPVFVLNVLDYFAQDDVDLMYSFATGETWSIPVDRHIDQAQVRTPSGALHPAAVHRGAAHFYGEVPGFYELILGDDVLPLAANLANPEESDITPHQLTSDDVEVVDHTADLIFDRRQIWIFLLLGALVLLLIEWFTYNRRWSE